MKTHEFSKKDIEKGLMALRDIAISIYWKNKKRYSDIEDIRYLPEGICMIRDSIWLVASAFKVQKDFADYETARIYMAINDMRNSASYTAKEPDKADVELALKLLFYASVQMDASSQRRQVYKAFLSITAVSPE